MAVTKNNEKISVSFDFSYKAVVAIIFGVLSAFGVATGVVNTGIGEDSTIESTPIVTEIQALRREVRELRILRYNVEDNTSRIDSLLMNQQDGFGAIWEQNKLMMRDIGNLNNLIQKGGAKD